MSLAVAHPLANDAALRQRARAVIPGGMYGHQNAASLPPGFPQFLERGDGCHIWDADGNEYIDFMCSYGPIVLGHRHPVVDAAAARQQALADCQNGPSQRIVELAELLVDTVDHADWAIFAKNGTDATTMCVTIARAGTRRSKVLVAKGAYHGAAPWCTPNPVGTTDADRANLITYRFNDLESVEKAVAEAGDDLAAILVSPFRHDARYDQELVDPAFARGLRRLCDDTDAALILDDVRCGFRLSLAGSWAPIGVRPDLSAWSKAIANGYALGAVLGNDRFRGGAKRIYTTGSFWFSAVSMAASIATIETMRDIDAIALDDPSRPTATRRPGRPGGGARPGHQPDRSGPDAVPHVRRRREVRHGQRVHRRGRQPRRLSPPLAQLVPVGGPHRRRRGPRAAGHRRRLRRGATGVRPLLDRF